MTEAKTFVPVKLICGMISSQNKVFGKAEDFLHRVPLQHGIYAHLELLFGKNDIRTLEWTYPDFKTESYQNFFRTVRKMYLEQLKA